MCSGSDPHRADTCHYSCHCSIQQLAIRINYFLISSYRVQVEQLIDVLYARAVPFKLHLKLEDSLSEVGWHSLLFGWELWLWVAWVTATTITWRVRGSVTSLFFQRHELLLLFGGWRFWSHLRCFGWDQSSGSAYESSHSATWATSDGSYSSLCSTNATLTVHCDFLIIH